MVLDLTLSQSDEIVGEKDNDHVLDVENSFWILVQNKDEDSFNGKGGGQWW